MHLLSLQKTHTGNEKLERFINEMLNKSWLVISQKIATSCPLGKPGRLQLEHHILGKIPLTIFRQKIQVRSSSFE